MNSRRLGLLAAAVGLAGFLIASGAADAALVQTNPGQVIATPRNGTITAGGTAQNAMAANVLRKGWCIQNDPAATETLYVQTDGAASATAGTAVPAGQQVCNPASVVTTGVISVFAATTGHRWFGTELQ